jgi:hypothetical protein
MKSQIAALHNVSFATRRYVAFDKIMPHPCQDPAKPVEKPKCPAGSILMFFECNRRSPLDFIDHIC